MGAQAEGLRAGEVVGGWRSGELATPPSVDTPGLSSRAPHLIGMWPRPGLPWLPHGF
jgi:hypothetical protein